MQDHTTAKNTAQNEQPENTENKKLRTGLKIRTRIKAGDGEYGGDGIISWNHGVKLRTAR